VKTLDQKNAIIAILVAALVVVSGVAIYYVTLPDDENNEVKTVYWLQIAPNAQAAKIASGDVAGGISWEPYCSDSIVAGTAHVIKWSEEIWPGHPCCIVAAKTSYLNSNQDLVLRMVRAHIEANLWISDALAHPDSDNYTKLMQMGAAFSNRNVTVVESAVGHIKFGYVMTPQDEAWFANFTQMFIDVGQITTLGGYASIDAFISDFVNTSAVTDAMAIQPSDTIVNPDNPLRLGFLAGDLHQFARVVAMNSTVFGGKTLFEKYGLNIQSANPAGYANGPAVMDAFAANVIDMGYLGSPPAIQKRLMANTDIKLVALANGEGSAILGGAGINSFEDFDGKIIATPGPASIQHLLLLNYAEQLNIRVKLAGT
jgi:NitT/TauT family transport system substrate-binding protein